jgi:hypothetical protein
VAALRTFYLTKALPADGLIGIVAVTVLGVIVSTTASWRQLSCFLDRDGVALYGALLGSLASLLGFSVTVIAVVSGLVQTRPFHKFREGEQYESFWAVFTVAVRTVGLATLVALLALFLTHVQVVRLVTLAAVSGTLAAATSSLIRGGLTLEKLLAVQRAFQRGGPP